MLGRHTSRKKPHASVHVATVRCSAILRRLIDAGRRLVSQLTQSGADVGTARTASNCPIPDCPIPDCLIWQDHVHDRDIYWKGPYR